MPASMADEETFFDWSFNILDHNTAEGTNEEHSLIEWDGKEQLHHDAHGGLDLSLSQSQTDSSSSQLTNYLPSPDPFFNVRSEGWDPEPRSLLLQEPNPSSFETYSQSDSVRLPSISNIVDLTSSSPSHLVTAQPTRAYSSRPTSRSPIFGTETSIRSDNNTIASPPKRQRRDCHRPSFLNHTEPEPNFENIFNNSSPANTRPSINDSSFPQNPPLSSSLRPPFRSTVPSIANIVDMSSNSFARNDSSLFDDIDNENEAESIDLRDGDDESDFTRILAHQRQQAILAQNSSQRPEADDFTKSTITHFKCPVCMDVLINVTATACGHLFCHKCIIDTLRFCEQRAEDEGKPIRGNCPVCRKPISRARNSKGMIQLKLMTRGKKSQQDRPINEGKGKGKEIEVGRASGSDNGRKRKRPTASDA